MIATQHQWIRVTKKLPCVICNHGDWCTACPELGLALCMRVESDRPSKNSMGGWIHRIGSDTPRGRILPVRSVQASKPIDAAQMCQDWGNTTSAARLEGLGASLGVSLWSLYQLGCCWCPLYGGAYAFPMREAGGKIIGIRLRSVDGQKFAVRGSQQGIFIPEDIFSDAEILYICEGVSDVCAMIDLGLSAIGKPSCSACDEMIVEFIKLRKWRSVVIMADADEPGQQGAEKLQSKLPVRSVIVTPCAKDVREAVRAGWTASDIASVTRDLVWSQP